MNIINHLILKPFVNELANGKFTANFTIFEIEEERTEIIPFYGQNYYENREKAFARAKEMGINYINKNYPKGTKYKIEKTI